MAGSAVVGDRLYLAREIARLVAALEEIEQALEEALALDEEGLTDGEDLYILLSTRVAAVLVEAGITDEEAGT